MSGSGPSPRNDSVVEGTPVPLDAQERLGDVELGQRWLITGAGGFDPLIHNAGLP